MRIGYIAFVPPFSQPHIEEEMTAETPLLGDFPVPSFEQWQKLVEPDLKGAPFEKRLVTKLIEGLSVQPLYATSDTLDERALGLPGQAPFRRGATALGHFPLGWQIVGEHSTSCPSACRDAIVRDLAGGVEALRIAVFTRFFGEPGATSDSGVWLDGVDDLSTLLEGVDLSRIPISLLGGSAFSSTATLLDAFFERAGIPATERLGEFAADPLGTFAACGTLPRRAETMLSEAAELTLRTAERSPKMTALQVSTEPYDNAGATAVDELAIALCTTLAMVRAVEQKGAAPKVAARQLSFLITVGTDQFLEIAKLRALRCLVSRLYELCGIVEADRRITITTRTSRRILSTRDPWVNILRTTMGCFASAIGGADRVIVLPFDAAIGPANEMAARLARNTQIILREEAHLGRVLDAAGGSAYVESLTQELAGAAWKRMQELEARGGMLAVLRDGSLKAELDQTREKRRKDIARRKTSITGVSEYPNLNEERLLRPAADTAKLEARRATRAKTEPSLHELVRAQPTDSESIAPLGLWRFAEGFEALRDLADQAALNGNRPSAFLATLGPIATHIARATYAQNFVEAGGLRAVSDPEALTPDAAVDALKRSACSVAIICSSDAWYETGVEELAPRLRAAGARTVVLAGNPGANEARYRAAGVDRFIFIGCDVEACLTELLRDQGVVS